MEPRCALRVRMDTRRWWTFCLEKRILKRTQVSESAGESGDIDRK